MNKFDHCMEVVMAILKLSVFPAWVVLVFLLVR